MINLIWDSAFKGSYKKRIRNHTHLKKKFWEAFDVFSQHPFDASLKTYKLTMREQELVASGMSQADAHTQTLMYIKSTTARIESNFITEALLSLNPVHICKIHNPIIRFR